MLTRIYIRFNGTYEIETVEAIPRVGRSWAWIVRSPELSIALWTGSRTPGFVKWIIYTTPDLLKEGNP